MEETRMSPAQAARLLGVSYDSVRRALLAADGGQLRATKNRLVTLAEARAAIAARRKYTRSWVRPN